MTTERTSVRDFYFPAPDARLLWIAGVLFALWIASSSGLRAELAVAGAPTWLTGSLPSALTAACTAALIAGSQGMGGAYSGLLGALGSASAEPIQFVSAGVPDWGDVLGAGVGGVVGGVIVLVAGPNGVTRRRAGRRR